MQEQQSETKTEGSTGAAEKKYEKLMDRFKKGGDMHHGSTTTKKTAEPTSYRLTVVTPEKGDLKKFGALLPSPTTDLNAHSVSGRVGLPDINETLVAVAKTLTATQPKKVRIVVEL